MSCENVQKRISLLLDRKLPARERESMLAHIEACRECETHFDMMQNQVALVRALGQSAIPADLKARLSVLASHECERALTRVSLSARLRAWTSRIDLAFQNLMRPVALPFFGGVLSTLLIFTALVPSLSFSHDLTGQEFYTFYTAPTGTMVTNPWDQVADADDDFPRIETPTAAPSDYYNVVDLTIDETGHVVDWKVLRGELTPDMKSIIMLGQFKPATEFGLPTQGTIRVVQSCASATVRG
jgi:anti-sigma factor (TIGR02949 family)